MPEHDVSNRPADNRTTVYRLVKERFINTPLSSEGAKRYGGRWNPVEKSILYTSASPELALLEQLVHLPALPYQDLPRLFLITIVFPSTPGTVEKLSPNWRDPANYYENHKLLENWLNDPDVMALKVPSAVVAESYNFLLHPLHMDYSEIEILSTKAFNIDSSLWNVRNA